MRRVRGSRAVLTAALAGAAVLVVAFPTSAGARPARTVLVSVSMAGGDANATSTRATVSSDGTDVVWTSDATDLVPGVTDGRWNVYERDVVTGVTTLVSVSDTGGEPDGTSNYPDVDTSGRYVVYSSDASDIVPGVTGHHDNVYEYDTATGTTSLVSVSTGGRPAAGSSTRPTVSTGGTAVGFQSTARDLVAGDTSSGAQIYVRDMATGATVLASVSEGGAAADRPCGYPVLSADGRHIAFVSAATNLTSLDTGGKHNIFERDLYGDVTSLVSAGMHATAADRSSSRPAISADGEYVAFESSAGNLVPDDTNKVTDVFRMDVRTGTMVRVSVGENGDQLTGASSRPSLSANGQIVGFASNDRRVTGTVVTTRNVYARAMTTGTNYLVSTTRGGGPGSCSAVVSPKGCLATRPAVSGDGAEMIFVSTFTDLAANATTGEPGVFEAPIG